MKQTYISLGLLITLSLSLLPTSASAYFTTNQNAIAYNATTAVFAIEYAFGHEDYDIYMPVVAQRGLMHDGTEKKAGYTFRENGDKVQTGGTATGIVVSKAPIVDSMYKIEKGTAQKMTLYVILTTPNDALEDDYALQMERLPYYMDKGGDSMEAFQLNPSELQYYVTKEVELNTGNFAN